MMELCYDGSRYSGWQGQPEQREVRTIQGELERAIREVTGEQVTVVASGRTDAGVHALYQVASFYVVTRLSAEILRRAVNASLPHAIQIYRMREVWPGFHPIRDVVRKRYRYLLSDTKPFVPFWSNYVWQVLKPVDVGRMAEAGAYLLGRHDFAAFQTVGSPRKTTVRTVFDLAVRIEDCPFPGPLPAGLPRPRLISVEVEADGFLYNMVRAIAGTLVAIGQSRKGFESAERMKAILESGDRSQAGPTAPAHGLFMVKVEYDTARFM